MRPQPVAPASLSPLPEGVTHGEIVHVLGRCGWVVVGERAGAYQRLKKYPHDRHAECLVVPVDPSAPDYESGMDAVLTRIGRIEPEAWGWLRYAGDASAQALLPIEEAGGAGRALDADALDALVRQRLHDPTVLSIKNTMTVAHLLRERASVLRSRADAFQEVAEAIANMAANGRTLGSGD